MMIPLSLLLLLPACHTRSADTGVSPREGLYVATTLFPEFSDCGTARSWAYAGKPPTVEIRDVTATTMTLYYAWPQGVADPTRSAIPCIRDDRTFRCSVEGDTGGAGVQMEIHVSGTWKSDTMFTVQWSAFANCVCSDTGMHAPTGPDTCMVVQPFRAERVGDGHVGEEEPPGRYIRRLLPPKVREAPPVP